jgi:hypothetical protein
MRLRLREFRARTGPYEHRVVQPWQPLRHTSLHAPDPIGLLLGDHDGLNRPAGLSSFAAYSRHTVVHVPLRDGIPSDEGGASGSTWSWPIPHPDCGPAHGPNCAGDCGAAHR